MMDRRQIKKLYKLKPPDMGVYQIRNLDNGKIFIGRATDLNGKMNSERFQLTNGMHVNRELQRDFSGQGEERFAFEVLERLAPKQGPGHDQSQELKELEETWLDRRRPYGEKGYNKKRP